jgi:hypothetical protein
MLEEIQTVDNYEKQLKTVNIEDINTNMKDELVSFMDTI